MARPRKTKRIGETPNYFNFKVSGEKKSSKNNENTINLTLEEYESIYLIDYKKLTHLEASKCMKIARSSVSNIYKSAREKIGKFIIEGKFLDIQGGNFRIISLEEIQNMDKMGNGHKHQNGKPKDKDIINLEKIQNVYKEKEKFHGENIYEKKPNNKIRIVIPLDENENFSSHFGKSSFLEIYDIDPLDLKKKNLGNTICKGRIKIHSKKGAIVGLILELKADILLVYNIGITAKTILEMENIKVISKNNKCIFENKDKDSHEILENLIKSKVFKWKI